MAGATNGKKKVIFSLYAPEAREVYLCGNFNDWEPAKTALKKDATGTWKAQLLLPPGTYEYRLRVDGEWADDPAASLRVPNGFGTMNCVREVAATAK